MKAQLKVIKQDGSSEQYLYTKVIATIGNAFAQAGEPDIVAAEQLADVITYTLYEKQKKRIISSSEILSVIKAALSATGYEEAAISLGEHNMERRLKRSRIDVVSVDMDNLSDARQFGEDGDSVTRSRWDKSRIVTDLMEKYGVERPAARAIASMVEQKVLAMDFSQVPASLIKQLVLSEAAVMLRAQSQLQKA